MYLMVKIKQLQVGFWKSFEYATAIIVIAFLIDEVISLVPLVGKYLDRIGLILIVMVVLGIGYIGLRRVKNQQI